MINFHLSIKNPFAKDNFKNLLCKAWRVSKNKTFEFEIIRSAPSLFELVLVLEWSGHDHAGPEFNIGVFGYSINIHLYDTRHWNRETHTWEIYDNTNS